MTMDDFALTRALIRNRAARDDERDDAAILLGEDDSPAKVSTLLEVIFDTSENEWLIGRAAEALGYIWSRSNSADMDLVNRMPAAARDELMGALNSRVDNPLFPGAPNRRSQ